MRHTRVNRHNHETLDIFLLTRVDVTCILGPTYRYLSILLSANFLLSYSRPDGLRANSSREANRLRGFAKSPMQLSFADYCGDARVGSLQSLSFVPRARTRVALPTFPTSTARPLGVSSQILVN